MKQRIGYEVILCRLAGVSFDRYQEWRDSIADEYFVMFSEAVFDEDVVKCLTRAI